VRTKQEILKAAIVTDATLKHARHLEKVFSSPTRWEFREHGKRIASERSRCEVLKLTATAICGLLSQSPEAKIPEFGKILAVMLKAKRELKESVRKHRPSLKVKL
jgi:hypothetical protein